MDYINFVTYDAAQLVDTLRAGYEEITQQTLQPADPINLWIQWAATMFVQAAARTNMAANMNVPSRAEGQYLEALGEIFRGVTRLAGRHAKCTLTFTLSTPLAVATTIPAGTRVSTADERYVFATDATAVIPPGYTTITVTATCTTDGAAANGLTVGSVNRLVDVFPYYRSVVNSDASTGGTDPETDAALRERYRLSTDTWSTAGAAGSYEYFARAADAAIIDVAAINGGAGVVNVYPLLVGGSLPDAAMLAKVAAALDAATVRPLTDTVNVLAPTQVTCNIEATYYVATPNSAGLAEIQGAVAAAVSAYKTWQTGALGRDLNPSRLHQLLMEAGVRRVVITAPVYTVLDADDVAVIGTEAITYGGLEDE